MQCNHIKPDGTSCNAKPMRDNTYCYFHNDQIADERKEAQIKGGKTSLTRIQESLDPLSLKNGEEVMNLLEDTINRVRSGEMDVKIANCIGVLSSNLIKAIEVTKVTNRIEIVERAILERKTISNF